MCVQHMCVYIWRVYLVTNPLCSEDCQILINYEEKRETRGSSVSLLRFTKLDYLNFCGFCALKVLLFWLFLLTCLNLSLFPLPLQLKEIQGNSCRKMVITKPLQILWKLSYWRSVKNPSGNDISGILALSIN